MKWIDCLPVPKTPNPLRAPNHVRRLMREEDRRYPVDRLVEIPRAEWPNAGPPRLVRVLRSRDFMVQVFHEDNRVVRLTVQRTELDANTGRWRDGITWDDLQHLKTLAGFGEATVIEIYPPDEDRVDVAAMRHLWIVSEPPAFMWKRA